MTTACGRCGTKAIAHINGVGLQCLACGQEQGQEDRDGAVVVLGDEEVVRGQDNDAMASVRSAAKALGLRYRLVLQWARNGELQATGWDPRQSRRGRRVWLADLKELVAQKKSVTCVECGTATWREELPRGKLRRFCRPPAKCKERYWARHRVR